MTHKSYKRLITILRKAHIYESSHHFDKSDEEDSLAAKIIREFNRMKKENHPTIEFLDSIEEPTEEELEDIEEEEGKKEMRLMELLDKQHKLNRAPRN